MQMIDLAKVQQLLSNYQDLLEALATQGILPAGFQQDRTRVMDALESIVELSAQQKYAN